MQKSWELTNNKIKERIRKDKKKYFDEKEFSTVKINRNIEKNWKMFVKIDKNIDKQEKKADILTLRYERQ